MTDRAAVSRWLAGYETAWRAPGTDSLTGIFTEEWPFWPECPDRADSS